MAEKRSSAGPGILSRAAAPGALLAVLCLSSGCGSGQAKVSGKVTLDNEPVSRAQVVFIVDDEARSSPYIAQTDESGQYKIIGNTGGGIPSGKYKVVVTRMALKDGTIPMDKALERARSDDTLVNVLPQVYADRGTTPFEFEVKSGSKTINLELKRQP